MIPVAFSTRNFWVSGEEGIDPIEVFLIKKYMEVMNGFEWEMLEMR